MTNESFGCENPFSNKRNWGITLILLGAMLCTSACDLLRDSDKKRFPPLSKTRPVGSAAGPSDSASIKRIDIHQFGQESWPPNANDFADEKRTKNVKTNSLKRHQDEVIGFVKFDKPGYLQARMYDDVYGDIDSGWSPRKVHIKPSKEPIYVAITLCHPYQADVVEEVCWFPDGAKEGVVVYSTAYPDVGEQLSAADVYGPEQLGNQYSFLDHVAVAAINENLKNGRVDAAQKILDDVGKHLKSMSDATSGVGGKKILRAAMNAQNWAMVRTYELGLALGEPSFPDKKKALVAVLNGPHWPETTADPTEREYSDMLPIYSWLNDQLIGKKSALPIIKAKADPFIAGHDPTSVTAYFQADKASERDAERNMFSNIDFWIAAKNFLRKDFKESEKHLTAFLQDRHLKGDAFEVAAAAKLKDFEFFELHPEK